MARHLKEHQLRIVLLGASEVGKTAIVKRFVQGVFAEGYEPTIEDSFQKDLMIPTVWWQEYCADDNQMQCKTATKTISINLTIVDTSGEEEIASNLRSLYLHNADAFVLVYSICSLASLKALEPIAKEIKKIHGDQALRMLIVIGNKCDGLGEQDREVTLEKATEWTQEQGIAEPLEASARSDLHIEKIFKGLIRQRLTGRTPFEAVDPNPGKPERTKKHHCQIA